LPAGTYRAVALEAIEQGQWEDREFLDGLRTGALRVELGEGAAQAITLKLPTRQR
jgi:hypothetical protein